MFFGVQKDTEGVIFEDWDNAKKKIFWFLFAVYG